MSFLTDGECAAKPGLRSRVHPWCTRNRDTAPPFSLAVACWTLAGAFGAGDGRRAHDLTVGGLLLGKMPPARMSPCLECGQERAGGTEATGLPPSDQRLAVGALVGERQQTLRRKRHSIPHRARMPRHTIPVSARQPRNPRPVQADSVARRTGWRTALSDAGRGGHLVGRPLLCGRRLGVASGGCPVVGVLGYARGTD